MLAQRAYVNRRVGGLEDALRQQQAATGVNRRVGGLEEEQEQQRQQQLVNRRVGGLEVFV